MGLCKCGCGEQTPIAKRNRLELGHVKGEHTEFIRGHASRVHNGRQTHGMFGTPEYTSYNSAKGRCQNSSNRNWKHYGGRGIRFLFTSFEQFFTELGARPAGSTLDRK